MPGVGLTSFIVLISRICVRVTKTQPKPHHSQVYVLACATREPNLVLSKLHQDTTEGIAASAPAFRTSLSLAETTGTRALIQAPLAWTTTMLPSTRDTMAPLLPRRTPKDQPACVLTITYPTAAATRSTTARNAVRRVQCPICLEFRRFLI